jgi:protein-disulfide isomerase
MPSRATAWIVPSLCAALACGPAPAPKSTSSAPPEAAPAAAPASGRGYWRQESVVPVSSEDPQRGPRDALVTVVLFSDFQCPFCARVRPTIEKLQQIYGTQLRVVWKDLPLEFHKDAFETATAAQIAFLARGNETFWKFHDRAFDNQKDLRDAIEWLTELGIGIDEIDRLRPRAEARVRSGIALSKALGIVGVPNCLVDGEVLTGAQPLEKFQATIDAHLAKAAEFVASGKGGDALYPAMVRHYHRPPAPSAATDDEDEVEDETVWAVEIGDAPQKGPKDAPVTIVVFSDFQCPFCKRHEPTLDRVVAAHPGQVRVVWKDMPLSFHVRAMPAANFAREARKLGGDAAFWKAHDAIFASQPKLDDADLEAIATKIGLDPKKLLAAVTTGRHKDAIARDVEQAGDVGVEGTPHSFVNGRVVNGAVPFEKFDAVVVAELAKAKAKIAAGTPAAKLYAETIKGGKRLGGIELPVPAGAPFIGGKDAKLVIHVFGDYECPFTRRALVGTADARGFSDVIKTYGDKIKIVFRAMPLAFHANARPAANLAYEALAQKGQAGFRAVHDALLRSASLDLGELEKIARAHGLDWSKAKAAIEGDLHKAKIEKDLADASTVAVTGTPSFLVGSRVVLGAQPEDVFQKAIDAALAKAKGGKKSP